MPRGEINPELLRRAIQKTVAKEELTQDEKAAFRAHEKRKEEELRWRYYESIPAKHWEQMSGRDCKVRNEQAARYDLPFGGPVINLPKLARAFHDFLSKNKLKLLRDETVVMDGPLSPALERYREERALVARLNRLEREGQLVDRDVVRQSMQRAGGVIRIAGEALMKQFGPVAAQILYDAIDDAEAEIERAFSTPAEVATDGAD